MGFFCYDANLMRCFLLCLLLPAITLFAKTDSHGDVQFWLNHATEKEPWIISSEFRFSDNVGRLSYAYLQLEYKIKLCSWLNFYPGYREVKTFRKGEWYSKHEPIVSALFYYKKKHLLVSFRSRAQFSHDEDATKDHHVVFRERLALTFLTGKKFDPYLEEELFFRKSDIYFQNRFSLGVKTHPNEKTVISMYAMFRWLKPERYQPIFGLKGAWVF